MMIVVVATRVMNHQMIDTTVMTVMESVDRDDRDGSDDSDGSDAGEPGRGVLQCRGSFHAYPGYKGHLITSDT